MGMLARLVNVFRSSRLNQEIDEELAAHLAEAAAAGRDPAEARRALGPALRLREESRDIRLVGWLDALRADAVFGWRQLTKRKAITAAAVLSLALAMGASTAALRLIDALLLRPLPVANPEQLRVFEYQYLDKTGRGATGDSYDYPFFTAACTALKGEAELLAISYAGRIGLTYAGDGETEQAVRQYLSGGVFETFGLQPATGRLFSAADDRPGAQAVAVLSHDYWRRRFGGDPAVVGRTLRSREQVFQIIGVVEKGFPGTEPGTLTDLFLPTMTNTRAVPKADWSWFRIWGRLAPGVTDEVAAAKFQAALAVSRREKAKSFPADMPRHELDDYINPRVGLIPAAAGVSGMQQTYRRSLWILGVLVALVLLIACANVANLMTAQAAARSREMALRVSIGAGRARLVQLVLVECTLLALAAALLGAVLAWWSAPAVVSLINPPGDPARLVLPADWRVLGFGAALTLVVTLLLGLAPGLRAAAVQPAAALKGGADPHARRRLMHVLVAVQVAFCFLVHFSAGLFVASFTRLANQPLGFSTSRLLALETVTKTARPVEEWRQLGELLQASAGVERTAVAGWALMGGNAWNSRIWIDNRIVDYPPYFLDVSPGWLETMRIPLLAGRDLTARDRFPGPAIINQAFAREYLDGRAPLGLWFETDGSDGRRVRFEIVGVAGDARYRNLREQPRPTIYVPLRSFETEMGPPTKDWATFLVRTSSDQPLALAGALRRTVSGAGAGFRVSEISTQQELVDGHTVRERMLATLSVFFAGVALLLAGVGLYGVMSYAVIERRREIGIRLALGARAGHVVRRVTTEILVMLLIGSGAGLAAGLYGERFFATLLFQASAREATLAVYPLATLFAAALLAALPPVARALRTDPATILRAE